MPRFATYPEFGLAIDVFASFSLVAAAIGVGLLPRIGPTGTAVWNAAVVLNVLGADIGRWWRR